MSKLLDPFDHDQPSAHARGQDRDLRGHGASTGATELWAIAAATARRRAAQDATALRQDPRIPRGYTRADHERAEALRGEAASLRRIAADKRDGASQRLVEREAANLERDAEAIVPLEHARAGWR